MQEKALVSVIVPVYNVEKYLRECIDSVLAQTYTNYEIILVDDGSTDSSGAICDEYAEKNNCITVIHKKNEGLSCARNSGFERASGKYVYFLDSDDYVTEDMLEQTVQVAQEDKSDIVFFDAIAFSEDDKCDVSQNYLRINRYDVHNGLKMFEELQRNNEFHSAVQLYIFKKSFLVETELRFVPGIYHEDMAFTFEAFCQAEIVSQCRKALYYRRYRPDSIMTSVKQPKHFNGMSSVYYHIKNFSEEKAMLSDPAVRRYISRCAYNCFNIFEQLDINDKKEHKTQMKEIKTDILSANAYGDKALQMRCYGKPFWAAYKVYEKTAGRLLRGHK